MKLASSNGSNRIAAIIVPLESMGLEEWQETSRQHCPGSCSNTMMLRRRAILGDHSTAGRLRRGLSPAHGPRAVDVMARDASFSRRQISSTHRASDGRDSGSASATASTGSWRVAALEVASDDPGDRSRNWMAESRNFYARLPRTIPGNSLGFPQEPGRHAPTFNARWIHPRTPRGDPPSGDFGAAGRAPRLQLCPKKHLKPRSLPPRTV
jgi:hypothetical protein